MIDISNRLECFFDDTLIDVEKTTAEFLLHSPERREIVMEHNEPWEGDGSNYHNMFYDEGRWRVYYDGWKTPGDEGIRICYAESVDGIHWVKPSLGICAFHGSTDNNILLDSTVIPELDNLMVFRDDNPACPPEKRYKGIYQKLNKETKYNALEYLISSDGIHFSKGGVITERGAFDSLNTVFWDGVAGKYRCYYRSDHHPGTTEPLTWFTFSEEDVRDIRYMESVDFESWSEPRLLDFGDVPDIPLYTNLIQPYYRAPHILIGFPTRYIYRKEWTANYDELCGKEKRLERMRMNPRYGLVTTDCVFACSRDGVHFRRYDEAFLRPGPENGKNWLYGDCYPARGIVEVPAKLEGAAPEMAIYTLDYHWIEPTRFVYNTLRLDGFVSLHADATEKVIVTKPFVYTGSKLTVNFSSSAWGYLYFTLTDEEGNAYESTETFGDSVERTVRFLDEKAVASLSGKRAVLTVRMRDADLYSIKFDGSSP